VRAVFELFLLLVATGGAIAARSVLSDTQAVMVAATIGPALLWRKAP
jgi:hypothetical protein